MQGVEGAHLLELQKAYPISEFTIVVWNHGRTLLCLASRLATMVSQSVSEWVT